MSAVATGPREPDGRHARFVLELSDFLGTFVVLRDVGPHDKHPTVTNDAEHVCRFLVDSTAIKPDGRIFYFDSYGDAAELVHVAGRFDTYAAWDGVTT